jgi:hypothetical protein
VPELTVEDGAVADDPDADDPDAPAAGTTPEDAPAESGTDAEAGQ